MIVTHDDLPHPVPPFAYLRYKENWFFIIIDVEHSVFGMAHFNYEPGFDRARVSCNLMVRGELFKYANQIPFPEHFAFAPQIGDERLTVRFLEPHARFALQLHSSDLELDLLFERQAPTFDYRDYDAANPEKPSARELMGFATNQLFEHQQQAMRIGGTLRLKAGSARGETIAMAGLGYRDHSRAMRSDNMTARHVWTCLLFPGTVFGAMSLNNVLRPGLTSNSGYVHDAAGLRSLRDIEVLRHGEEPGQMPAQVEFRFSDVYGRTFNVMADIAGRYGHVPLVAEAASSSGFSYHIVENFCPVTLLETGERGHALVEMGFNSKPAVDSTPSPGLP